MDDSFVLKCDPQLASVMNNIFRIKKEQNEQIAWIIKQVPKLIEFSENLNIENTTLIEKYEFFEFMSYIFTIISKYPTILLAKENETLDIEKCKKYIQKHFDFVLDTESKLDEILKYIMKIKENGRNKDIFKILMKEFCTHLKPRKKAELRRLTMKCNNRRKTFKL